MVGETKDLIGKKLSSVRVCEDKEHLLIEFADGTSVIFQTFGDCCLHSWIEHLELPGDIKGKVLTAIEDSDVVDCDDDDDEGCLKVYNTKLRTTGGDIVIEYRNSSNGYYGGWLERVSA